MTRSSVAAALAAMGALCAFAAPTARAADGAGRLLAARRDVVVVREGAGRIAASPELALAPKDAVETGAGARVKLFMLDDTVLNLGENGRLALEQYSFAQETQRSKAVWQLRQGTIKVALGRSDLEVRMPAAVASARGTAFFAWTEGTPAGKSCIAVLEGSVALRGLEPQAAKEVVVGAGSVSCAAPREAPGAATPGAAALLKKLAADTTALAGTDWGRVRALPPAFAPEPAAVGETTAEGPGSEKGSGEEVKGFVRPPIPQQPVVVIPPPPPPPTVPPVVPPRPPKPPAEEQQR